MEPTQKSIVIVDDEEEVRELLRDIFIQHGYRVFSAENGLRLIAILRSEHVDAVLLDINMPWLSGYQICKSIKSDQVLCRIKVVYVSGLVVNEDECYATGCDGIIRKPFSVQAVVEKITSLIAQSA